MRTAKFQYKCRHCGEVFQGPCGGEQFASFSIASIITTGKDIPHPGHQVRLMDSHNCSDSKIGIADLIGYNLTD